MKKNIALFCLLLFAVVLASAQDQNTERSNISSLSTQSLNGSTGLFTLPSGRIGWNTTNLGFDIGYRAIINNDRAAHIPAVTMSFLKWVEISTAFDIQPRYVWEGREQENDDFLLGLKIGIPTSARSNFNTAIALGGSFQMLNFNNQDKNHPEYQYFAYQPYVAITYAGKFFNMSAETTLVLGKTFYSGGPANNSNIDFGMGFDLILFPDVFKDVVHWIIDFSNFS
jgi:hypothetical protein